MKQSFFEEPLGKKGLLFSIEQTLIDKEILRQMNMIRKFKIFLPVFAVIYQFFYVAKTFAADPGVGVGVSIPKDASSNYIQSGQKYYFSQYIQNIYGFAMKAAIALSILMVVYAGYKYMTSRGDSAAINEAKDILFSTLMGAALLMLVVLVGNIAGIATVNWGI